MEYTQSQILRIAKRFRNAKRSYLLVNPLQAKHLPVSPSQALDMMETLGEQVRAEFPSAKLVIGFAETATAIGAAVAHCLGADCRYLQTTRETVPAGQNWMLFREEHSHAVEQKLCVDALGAWLDETDTVIFVDDEISTGKTLCNMLGQLRASFPQLAEKQLVAASILNRMSPEQEEQLHQMGMVSRCLVHLPDLNPEAAVQDITVEEAPYAASADGVWKKEVLPDAPSCLNPRLGVSIEAYWENCLQRADALLGRFSSQLSDSRKTLVLGTEECMLPALLLGRQLERRELGGAVRCHATTRSPIGLSQTPGYPIQNGCKLKSFYRDSVDTYLYALEPYDTVIVVSDTPETELEALQMVRAVWNDVPQMLYLQGGNHVWYISDR